MSNRTSSGTALNKNSGKPWYREWGEAIGVALILALIIRTFLFQAFKIPSGSMEDTLLIGDHLLVNKFIYGLQVPWSEERFLSLRNPQRGDVIVFEFPLDEDLPFYKRRDFIKRVIGVPGDTVEVRSKVVYINGEALNIPQAVHKGPFFAEDPRRDNLAPQQVPGGQYFVMGDNRDRSYDSRFWGFVEKSEIKGLAFIKYWSWDSKKHSPRWNRMGRLIK
ncbi:signal peptidase I [Syntrophotalea carbinolica DSM 2380]|uniref:Signal peptidase I n=1 Tax=Syntrophotalea carbinolica (strain DSM 2380 / NBRC 103641 / GraBd1) TaxID=338963 RepID=Q3A446_SYNC1|nr:signal peptidase I [Syntrophotalea carbinolica]ABA88861.1 signal peptidase I [Syntrophotalea carbinolica DSM 2380]